MGLRGDVANAHITVDAGVNRRTVADTEQIDITFLSSMQGITIAVRYKHRKAKLRAALPRSH